MMFFLAKEVQQVDGNLGFVGLFVSCQCEDVLCLEGLDESTLKKMLVQLKFERNRALSFHSRSFLKLDHDQSKS